MSDDKARAALVDERQILDAKKIAAEIEALRNGDQEYDFICNITGYHLRLFAEGLRALVSPSSPASFRRIYDEMQCGKVSADERQEPETNPYVADDGQFGAGA